MKAATRRVGKRTSLFTPEGIEIGYIERVNLGPLGLAYDAYYVPTPLSGEANHIKLCSCGGGTVPSCRARAFTAIRRRAEQDGRWI
jgi:hypothetical protein